MRLQARVGKLGRELCSEWQFYINVYICVLYIRDVPFSASAARGRLQYANRSTALCPLNTLGQFMKMDGRFYLCAMDLRWSQGEIELVHTAAEHCPDECTELLWLCKKKARSRFFFTLVKPPQLSGKLISINFPFNCNAIHSSWLASLHFSFFFCNWKQVILIFKWWCEY